MGRTDFDRILNTLSISRPDCLEMRSTSMGENSWLSSIALDCGPSSIAFRGNNSKRKTRNQRDNTVVLTL